MLLKYIFLYSKNHNLSLKGISGVLFGVISILFIYSIYNFLDQFSAGVGIGLIPISFFEIILIIISIIYIFISFFTIVSINKRRRKKMQLSGWEMNSKKIVYIFLCFLALGGIGTYLLLTNGQLKLIIPLSLFLYGFTYLIIKKYTNVKSTLFGVLFISAGITAYFLPNYMYLLWGISFGVYHIIYGIYESFFLRSS